MLTVLRHARPARADDGLDDQSACRGMRRVVEFVCLLPLAIPAIVLVVGIAPIYPGWA